MYYIIISSSSSSYYYYLVFAFTIPWNTAICKQLWSSSSNTGYRDDEEENTFGTVMKNNVYYPCSDFRFTLQSEVICEITSSSGYLITLTSRNSTATRYLHTVIVHVCERGTFYKE